MSEKPTQPDEQGAVVQGAVDPNLPADSSRRFWITTTCTLAGVGGVAAAVPYAWSLVPSARAKAAGAPVEVDLSTLAPGTQIVAEWRGQPIFIVHRTDAEVEDLAKHNDELADPFSKDVEFTPYPWCQNVWRSRRKDIFICIGICTHLGCVPTPEFKTGAQAGLPNDWPGGYLCPCHGSTYDMAARVFKNKPAPDNMKIPPYAFSPDNKTVIIGLEEYPTKKS
ncbi:MAG TPA: ubiquinol-cytochrome c reductase iron-sulfur subunit [Castellaniella sp.]|uniref:ubiquinol-cytochrome c reductase iron-sulfur subunit n=1 Tax=Castellaniella sp. TaxID=1955812 RepID=UPI002F1A1E93